MKISSQNDELSSSVAYLCLLEAIERKQLTNEDVQHWPDARFRRREGRRRRLATPSREVEERRILCQLGSSPRLAAAQRLLYLSLSALLLASELAFICCSSSSTRTPDQPADEVRRFVRSEAATDKNLELLSRLESSLSPSDYQLFYPHLLEAGPEEDRKETGDVSQGARLSRQSNLRQSSVVQGASNWLQASDRQQDKQQHPSSQSQQSGPPSQTTAASKLQQTKSNQVLGHYNRTNVVIKAFNYKFRLDLELNNNLFGPGLIQKHFLPKGAQQISTQKLEHCYYHASTQTGTRPAAIGAFRTCNGLSGIIHLDNESFVIHPLFDADLSKHPHIIYRYQSDFNHVAEQSDSSRQPIVRLCGNARLHQWALRQYSSNSNTNNNNNNNNSLTSIAGGAKLLQRQRFERDHSADDNQLDTKANSNSSSTSINDCDPIKADESSYLQAQSATNKQEVAYRERRRKRSKFSRDVSLTEKYIELALILSQDMFDKRNTSSRLEVLHDSIQIINCLDLYFRYSANTRVALIYLETWAHGDQIDLSSTNDVKQILYNFLEYSTRKLYRVSMDAAHLLTGGHARTFEANEMGMSIPDSICSARAVSVSQEASTYEPFIAASTIAHMLGHNLGMEHIGQSSAAEQQQTSATGAPADGAASPSAEPFRDYSPRTDFVNPKPLDDSRRAPVRISAAGSKLSSVKNNGDTDQEPNEDHEDEIKSRSLDYNTNDGEQPDEEEPNAGRFIVEQDHWCTSNCLMSESFTYTQPVSFGNMIQQQVAAATATTNGSSGSILAMFPAGDNPMIDTRDGSSMDSHYIPGSKVPALNSATLSQQQLPFRFSRKSIDTYHRLLRTGRGICLFNKPNQLEDFKSCGNGIVDRGEDCDCGTFQECIENGDTCCDPITCRFKADAECITGACCDRCRLRPRGTVCRRARGECDLPEVCDGKSGQCSPDVHKQNGQSCANNTGFCYLGQCPSHDAQCSELWGLDARKSHRYCYSTFNSNGTVRGNCGLEQPQISASGGGAAGSLSKKYKRCELDSVLCGTLQCQMGDMKPITASSSSNNATATQQTEFSKRTIHSIDGGYHECKAITGPTSSNLQLSYVRDGVKCGADRVCFNQTCQPIEKAYRDSFELCPRDEKGRQCSGNGICSTAHRCHCEPGWLGHDCSQKTMPASIRVEVGPNGAQSPLDQLMKPSLTLLEPINVTEMPARQPQPIGQSAPPALMDSKPQESLNATTAPTAPATTSSTTTTMAPLPPPPPVVSPSNVVLDKKKHDALGAPTLVFILVSIVAAVYVGFALMANCYRRKGLLRPDKVLRHHQMNCRLDALRSSFIAKRLADAAIVGSFDQQSGSTSLMHQPNLLLPDPSLSSGANPNSNLFSQAPASAQFAMQEATPMQPPYDNSAGPESRGFLPSAFRRYPFSGLRNAPALGANKTPLQTTAQMHYHGPDQQEQQHQPHHSYCNHHQQQRSDHPMEQAGSCDHIPLLTSVSGHQHHNHQPRMRSFKSQQRQATNNPTIGLIGQQQTTARARSMSRQVSKSSLNNINRATSLGSVNAKQEGLWNIMDCEDGDEQEGLAGYSRYAHKVLATPVRTLRGYRNGPHTTMGHDSLSVASSPEHDFVGASNWPGDVSMRAHDYQENSINRCKSLSRQQSGSRLMPITGYHEDLLLGATLLNLAPNEIVDDDDDDNGSNELALTPPPPPPKSNSSRLAGESVSRADDDLMTTEEESTELSTVIHQQKQNPKRPNESETTKKSSPLWLRQRVKRIPLNNSGQDNHLEAGELEVGDEQLTLLAQLQQLEQVQSLHQRQVANHKPANEAGTLHEFFSLPLSVQLSALLARSLNAPPNQSTTIDEYLNTLNSSSVATMSRQSFKGSSKQAVAGGSGTFKRHQQQQIKLHNLQSLINRLQNLHQHQQQQQQQHLMDDDEFQSESVYEQSSHLPSSSRQSTLGRRSVSRSSRQMATADDLSGSVARRRASRRSIPRRSPDDRNESVYSMSDSEDGATYASRILNPKLQQQRKIPPHGIMADQVRQTKEIASSGVDLNKRQSETLSGSSEAQSTSPNQCQPTTNSQGNKNHDNGSQHSTNDLKDDKPTTVGEDVDSAETANQ